MTYRKLSELVHLVDIKNTDCKVTRVIGVSITKNFIPSVANLNGVDLTKYNLIKKNQFACKLMSVGRDLQLPIDLYKEDDLALISSAYYVFEVKDENEILPDYLNMWFRRKETDRWVGYISGGDVRGGISWDMFLEMDVNAPSIEKQREIVAQYQAVENKINVNEQICEKLEATAQTLYKQWFVDFEFPVPSATNLELVEGYKSSGGAMVFNQELEMEIPEGWEVDSFTKLCRIGGGGTPKTDVPEYWISGDVPFYSPGDKNENFYTIRTEKSITEIGLKKCSSKLYPVNTTFVTARGATTGGLTLAGIPMAMNQTCYAILSVIDKPIFTFHQTKSIIESIKSQAVGATFEAVVTKNFEESRIITPDYQTIEIFEKKVKHLFDQILNINFQNQKLTQLQSLLLSRLATLEG